MKSFRMDLLQKREKEEEKGVENVIIVKQFDWWLKSVRTKSKVAPEAREKKQAKRTQLNPVIFMLTVWSRTCNTTHSHTRSAGSNRWWNTEEYGFRERPPSAQQDWTTPKQRTVNKTGPFFLFSKGKTVLIFTLAKGKREPRSLWAARYYQVNSHGERVAITKTQPADWNSGEGRWALQSFSLAFFCARPRHRFSL